MAKELKVSISTIQKYKNRLNLPTRQYPQETFQFEESLLRKLYGSRATYAEIAEKLGCATTTVMNIRKRLSLQDREPHQKKDLNREKLVAMYKAKATHRELSHAFNISVETIQRKRTKYCLSPRKNVSSY